MSKAIVENSQLHTAAARQIAAQSPIAGNLLPMGFSVHSLVAHCLLSLLNAHTPSQEQQLWIAILEAGPDSYEPSMDTHPHAGQRLLAAHYFITRSRLESPTSSELTLRACADGRPGFPFFGSGRPLNRNLKKGACFFCTRPQLLV
jgi:hypothetical protein